MAFRAVTAVVASLLLALPGCGGPAGADDPRPVRVVLVSLDTLRHDRFDEKTMPRLHAAARDALVFDRFYAASSVTLPSHVSMFSGLHLWQHGVMKNGAVVGDAVRTVAERLAEAGFSTAAVVASFPLERRFRCDQGFETYVDDFVQVSDKQTWTGEVVPGARFSSPADVVTDHALRLLDEATADRQFLFVHYFDPHAPYGDEGPSLQLNQLLRAARERDPALPDMIAQAERLYDDDVRLLDRHLGRLLDRLAAERDRFETHVLVTADHGESFGDDGSLGHGKRLSPPQIHVPCVLLSPRVEPGRRADVAGSVDVLPTLLALAGLPAEPELPGRNLAAPPPSAPRALGMRSLFGPAQRDQRTDGRAERVDDLRFFLAESEALYIGNGGSLEPTGTDVDPDVARDVSRLFDDFTAQLQTRMAEMVESVDPETLEALEALGYLR